MDSLHFSERRNSSSKNSIIIFWKRSKDRNVRKSRFFRKLIRTDVGTCWILWSSKVHRKIVAPDTDLDNIALYNCREYTCGFVLSFAHARFWILSPTYQILATVARKRKILLAGPHIEAISPLAISPSNKAIHYLRTTQIYLYRTSHTGAMRYPISDILLYCLVI